MTITGASEAWTIPTMIARRGLRYVIDLNPEPNDETNSASKYRFGSGGGGHSFVTFPVKQRCG
jgi:hypothetical protein